MSGARDMDVTMADSGDIDIRHAPSAAISDFRSKPTEEDESSLSSSSADLLDQSSVEPVNGKGKWGFAADGTWRRYGSSESATSTGMSSMSSSIAADDKTLPSSTQLSPSKKRMSDGSLKQLATRLGAQPEVTQPTQPADQTTQQPAPKRRGRPPKDKSALAGYTGKERRASAISRLHGLVRPRSSLPTQLPKEIFASQCLDAAHASRLDPYALHPGEHQLLNRWLLNSEITVYLNIRNAILRLWVQNPLCAVTVEEAAGCAKDGRFFGLAEVAYKWLVRNGYINFGCVEVPRDPILSTKAMKNHIQKTVVVIGAGVSGLTTARQLENLFAQSSESWTDFGERPPRVVVLEGKNRIGGRVYSKPLRDQKAGSLPGNLRNTAEMGAMIVTGFEHGNPLNAIIRGQLGLRYHSMTDELTIYDCDGKAVDEEKDMINTELYTDISDRAGEFRALPQHQITDRGNEELIDRARDPPADGIEGFQLEPLFPIDAAKRKPVTKRGRRRNAPPGTEKLTGRSRVIEESGATQSAAQAAKAMGWQLREGATKKPSVSLHRFASASANSTLGAVMDKAIEQYQELIDLTPQDMRLLNWHHANLEYANAAPVSSLSLSGHDQDTGNEFEGAHSEIIGGYSQLPRGLVNVPTKLDVRFGREVESIHYNDRGDPAFPFATKVVCADGEVIVADEVVITAPLGVLKTDAIDFDPPLPGWKRGAIDRMGFGLLNKLVLLYDEPFWDDDRDMFGLLNEAANHDSLNPDDYAQKRGRFYLIWNASKISGRPMLVALMAGHSAHEAEQMDTTTLLEDINKRLRKTFASQTVPAPREVIVTRWKKDPFTRGTYSYVGPETRPGDYDLMARPVGNLHFAGEATCGTHPATVHGAFLSGLRVAAEVMEALIGPISLPSPLVIPPEIKPEILAQMPMSYYPMSHSMPQHSTSYGGGGSWGMMSFGSEQVAPPQQSAPFIKQESGDISMANVPFAYPGMLMRKPSGPPKQSVCSSDQSFWVQPAAFDTNDLNYEASIIGAVLAELGERPPKPSRPGVNPFLLYTKDKWEECKVYCSSGDPDAAGGDNIRQTLGKWWKAASDEVKAPYLATSQSAQELADGIRKEWEQRAQRWDDAARVIRREYVRTHAPPMRRGGNDAMEEVVGLSKRKTNVSNCVVLDHA
ncbi:hypothetical protein LTR85_006327 [Meristemomyces frigidus]|nr:hypothetical protein LTR85_006327 [Meristemomyces frigidus]